MPAEKVKAQMNHPPEYWSSGAGVSCSVSWSVSWSGDDERRGALGPDRSCSATLAILQPRCLYHPDVYGVQYKVCC